MPDLKIKIQNCNNIKDGTIDIQAEKLNILFGRNGTGKSTIARAIRFVSEEKPLTDLIPYGIKDETAVPNLEGISPGSIVVFDDYYVEKYVFQEKTVIENAFEVLVRSDEYDQAKKNIDEALLAIKTTITGRTEIIDLRTQIGVLIDKLKLTTDNKIARRGGTKSVLEGKGAYFNPPSELGELTPFFEEKIVSSWANWRLTGHDQFGNKGRCPYCSTNDNETTTTINRVFIGSFDKASVETATAIITALEALKPYLDEEKLAELESFFGVKENLLVLEAQLTKVGVEAKYLHDQLTNIVTFNGSSVDRSNLADLESNLIGMKIDLRACEIFFNSDLLQTVTESINTEIDNLLNKVGALKGEIGKYNTYIEEKALARKKDINEFLNIAGFRYTFDVQIDGENNARALLKFILPDGKSGDIQAPGKHLSWGEKHAFALILFMFDAISKNAELIILDDPISSFDNNKKYAIINRLFKTGDKANSLYQRTVLMMTHDIEPVIDYIQVGSGRQAPTTVCAAYFENNNGCLCSTPIQKNSDLLSTVVLLKELASDSSIDIVARIGCLRKFIEHQHRNPRDESLAYNVISSLIHNRTEPTRDNEGLDKLLPEEVQEGISEIQRFIQDFDYATALTQFKVENLLGRCTPDKSSYIKMLILRAYTEQDENARARLRSTNDVLRKYVDETFHIENDYLYSLDVRRFSIVPDNYISDMEKFVSAEKARLLLE